MKVKTTRLFFIDAMRAWAIIMMLQGHFIDGLLADAFRDNSDNIYTLWKYFRGMTAPVFFTVSGFIFTYLLIRSPEKGFANPRIKKGIRRGIELLIIGYLLRMNLMGLVHGEIYASFYLVDVLHCIGFSLLGIIGIYLVSYGKQKVLFSTILLAITMVLFLFEPQYSKWTFNHLPDFFANYLTKSNGSVFTIIPWFGYATMGAFIAVLFTRYKNHKNLYKIAVPSSVVLGLLLIFFSSDFFLAISEVTGLRLFADIFYNNYLFIRLGDVFIVFAVFMLIRKWLTNNTLLKVGQSTLSIYIIHFVILYGSFTGLGLYQFYSRSLSPTEVLLGALIFVLVCCVIALYYERQKALIKSTLRNFVKFTWNYIKPLLRILFAKAKMLLAKLFGLVKN